MNHSQSHASSDTQPIAANTAIEPQHVSLRQIRNFRSCPRLFAFEKGLISVAGGELLKNLRSLPALVGIAVHAGAAEALAAFCVGERPNADAIIARTVQRVDEQINWSRARRFEIHPDTVALEEDVFGTGISESRAADARRDVAAMMRNFFGTRLVEVLQMNLAKPAGQRAVTFHEIEDLNFFTLTVDGHPTKIWLKTDAILHNRDGDMTAIFDWKTSARATAIDHEQAGLYALYLREKYGVEQPAVRVVNLRGERWKEPWKWAATAADLDATRTWLTTEIRLLRRAWRDAETTTAGATTAGDTGAARAAWPQLPLGSPACERCIYRGPAACNRALPR